MKILDILKTDEYLYSCVDPQTEFEDITTNINEVTENSLLIIPNSNKIDNDCRLKNSPVAIICDDPDVLKNEDAKILVDNPRLTLTKALSRYYDIDFKKFTTIGITGTNGKTSTATMIKTILSDCGYKIGFFGTGIIEIDGKNIAPENYSMTTPDPELLYRSIKEMELVGCTAVVMEVSSHALALDKVAAIPFDYGVFTNLGEDHLDFHGSKEEYFKAKLKIFDISKTAVFNIDDEYARRACGVTRTSGTITAGILWRGDVYATELENHNFDGISYMYHGKNFIFKMNLKLNGLFNAYNSMLAAAVCIDMNCKPCRVKEILESIDSISGRYEIIKEDLTVVIDYAHTPTSFEAILNELKNSSLSANLTVVFGCGGERDRVKRPKMAKIAEKYADIILLTSDNPRGESSDDIFNDISKGFTKDHLIIENRPEAIAHAICNARPGDVVALIGKGCEPYYIDERGYHKYNEKDIVLKALSERKHKKHYESKA